MGAPHVEQEPFMVVEVDLRMNPIGTTAFGTRLEVPFEGTATSRLWEGARRVWGIDHRRAVTGREPLPHHQRRPLGRSQHRQHRPHVV